MYSEKVMDHFRNPRNVGEIPDADGIGEVGNPVCGDMMAFYIKVEDNIVTDVKFKTFGCGAAIAVSSMVSEMAKGRTIEDAKKITNKMVADELDGLPKNKMHCSNLGAEALHKAIENYLKRKSNNLEKSKSLNNEANITKDKCHCPVCDVPLGEDEACRACGVNLELCPLCKTRIPKGMEVCPVCNKKLK